ncbi:peptidase insulinase like peptidase [Cryptosporidium bovis]|uniref:peptidase insulinase like peptidase n=1 Tax=Cryptosporidium bovis TaxID=310047 RepID=UPI003519F15D|nr:peptidase insulinase like peptidase [Cryptosporidium bovis]
MSRKLRLNNIVLLLTAIICTSFISRSSLATENSNISLVSLRERVDLNGDKFQGSILSIVDDDEFLKPVISERSYRYVKLLNELEVFLVSDSKTTKSTALMNVKVGSSMEPGILYGLAHYLEHLLFINSEKYPDLDGFMKFIGLHNGYTNAHTHSYKTVYELTVDSLSFDEALDRFSEFFKAPLFDDTYTYKELMAIENEFNYAKTDDDLRLYFVLKSLVDKKSLFSRFDFGNLDTLKRIPESIGIDVREEVIKFFKSEYSSNRMVLVLTGNQSLDELTNMAIKHFSGIENKNLPIQTFSEPIDKNSVNPFKSLTNKIVLLDSFGNDMRIKVIFPLKRYMPKTISQDRLFLLERYISSKRKGGLYQYLYNSRLIFDMDLDVDDYNIGFSYVELTVTLTKKGEKNLFLIFEAFFSVIKLIKNTEPKIDLYNEKKMTSLSSFDYGKVLSLFDESNNILETYYNYESKPEEVLKKSYLISDFDMETHEEIMSQINPDNMLVFFRVKNLEDVINNSISVEDNIICSLYPSSEHLEDKVYNELLLSSKLSIGEILEENYTKAKYVTKELNPCFISYLKQVTPKMAIEKFGITHSEPNPYISGDFSNNLNGVTVENVPIRLGDALSKYGKSNVNKDLSSEYENFGLYKDFFYYPTHILNIPKVTFKVMFDFPLDKVLKNSVSITTNSLRLELYSYLFSVLISTKFSQELFELDLASYLASMSTSSFSSSYLNTIQATFVSFGFTDKMPLVMYRSAQLIREFSKKVTKHEFDIQIQLLEKKLMDYFDNPEISDEYSRMLNKLNFNQDLSPEAKLKELSSLDFQEFIEFTDLLLNASKLSGFVFGNMDPKAVVDILDHFFTTLYTEENRKITSNNEFSFMFVSDFFFSLWDRFRSLYTSLKNYFGCNESQMGEYSHIPDHLRSDLYIHNSTESLGNLQILDVVSLPRKSKYYLFKISESKIDINSAIILNIYVDYRSLGSFLLTNLLVSIISDQFFAELRTDKQLGYIVYSTYKTFSGHISGFSFVVVSSNNNVDVISENVLEFWDKWFSTSSNLITNEMFDVSRLSYIEYLKDELTSFADVNAEYSDTIQRKEYDFEWRERSIQFLKDISFKDFINWYRNIYDYSNMVMFAIQSPNSISNSSELDRLKEFTPNEFTKLDEAKTLFSMEGVRAFNQIKIFNID